MDRPRQLKAGILMLTTLVVGALVFLLALGANRFQTRHQFLTRGLEQSWQTQESARAGLERALRQVKAHQDAAVQKELGNTTVTVTEVAQGRDRPEGVLHLRSTAQSRRLRSTEEALVRQPRVLLSEDFNGSADGWSPPAVVGLGFYILDTQLGVSHSLAGDPDWDDYVAEFDALLSQGLGLGVLVRATPVAGGYQGYRVRWTSLPPRVTLTRVGPDGEVVLAQHTTALLDLNLSHRYRVRARRDTLEVEIDGILLFQVTDPEPILTGAVGVEPILGSVVLLDRVEVRTEFEVLARWKP